MQETTAPQRPIEHDNPPEGIPPTFLAATRMKKNIFSGESIASSQQFDTKNQVTQKDIATAIGNISIKERQTATGTKDQWGKDMKRYVDGLVTKASTGDQESRQSANFAISFIEHLTQVEVESITSEVLVDTIYNSFLNSKNPQTEAFEEAFFDFCDVLQKQHFMYSPEFIRLDITQRPDILGIFNMFGSKAASLMQTHILETVLPDQEIKQISDSDDFEKELPAPYRDAMNDLGTEITALTKNTTNPEEETSDKVISHEEPDPMPTSLTNETPSEPVPTILSTTEAKPEKVSVLEVVTEIQQKGIGVLMGYGANVIDSAQAFMQGYNFSTASSAKRLHLEHFTDFTRIAALADKITNTTDYPHEQILVIQPHQPTLTERTQQSPINTEGLMEIIYLMPEIGTGNHDYRAMSLLLPIETTQKLASLIKSEPSDIDLVANMLFPDMKELERAQRDQGKYYGRYQSDRLFITNGLSGIHGERKEYDLNLSPIYERLPEEQPLPSDKVAPVSDITEQSTAIQAAIQPSTIDTQETDHLLTALPLHSPETSTNLEQQAETWKNILKERGAGYLHGKFDRTWQVNNDILKADLEGQPPQDTPQYAFPINARSREIYLGRFNSASIESHLAATVQQLEQDPQRYYLVHDRAMYEGSGEVMQFAYCIRNTSNSEHNTQWMEFYFELPTDQGTNFLDEIQTNPDLIEATFQKLFVGLTQNGFKRLNAPELQVVKAIRGTYGHLNPVQRDNLKRTTIPFSHPMGEEENDAPWML